MKYFAILILAASGISSPSNAKEAPPIELPLDKWQLSYNDNSCDLIARFGRADEAILLKLSKYQPGDGFELTLAGKQLRAVDDVARLTYDFGLGAKPGRVTAIVGTYGDLPLLSTTGMRFDNSGWVDSNSPITSAQEAGVTSLTISSDTFRPRRLMLGSMSKPMAGLRACTTDLMRHLGYNPTYYDQVGTGAKPLNSPAYWLSSTDYPNRELEAGRNGYVKFRLDIDELGRVTRCAIIAQTSSPDFEAATCKAISKNAKFRPALDKSGKPMKALYFNSARYIW